MCNPHSDRAVVIKRWLIVACLLLTAAAQVGCTNRNKVSSLLGDDLELFPCWWGICPGESQKTDEVMSILEKIKGISSIAYDPSHRKVRFLWNDQGCGDISACQVRGEVVYNGSYIANITLYPDYDIAVSELLAHIGSPSCVYVMNSEPIFGVFISYLEMGIDIGLVPMTDNTAHVMKGDMLIRVFYIMDKNINGGCTGDDDMNAYKWRGLNVVYP